MARSNEVGFVGIVAAKISCCCYTRQDNKCIDAVIYVFQVAVLHVALRIGRDGLCGRSTTVKCVNVEVVQVDMNRKYARNTGSGQEDGRT